MLCMTLRTCNMLRRFPAQMGSPAASCFSTCHTKNLKAGHKCSYSSCSIPSKC
jgi:hypothetical protein